MNLWATGFSCFIIILLAFLSDKSTTFAAVAATAPITSAISMVLMLTSSMGEGNKYEASKNTSDTEMEHLTAEAEATTSTTNITGKECINDSAIESEGEKKIQLLVDFSTSLVKGIFCSLIFAITANLLLQRSVWMKEKDALMALARALSLSFIVWIVAWAIFLRKPSPATEAT